MIIQFKLDPRHLLDPYAWEDDVIWVDIPLPKEYTDPLIFLNSFPDRKDGDEFRIIYDDGHIDYAEAVLPDTPKPEIIFCKSP